MDALEIKVKDTFGTRITGHVTNEQIYVALLELVKEEAEKKVTTEGKKKLYYISAEFLIGKLLSNNLINLGLYDAGGSLPARNTERSLCAVDRDHRAGTISWKRWTWSSGCLLSGFHRYT